MNRLRTTVKIAAGGGLIALAACAHEAPPDTNRMARPGLSPLARSEDAISPALDRSVIPAIDLSGADVLTALSVWARESTRHNPLQTPFNYICAVAAPAPITLRVRNVTSRQVLDEICRQAGLVWWVERGRIMIGPPQPAPRNRP